MCSFADTSGDMVFYESSKCNHGRPRRLNGSWYSSVFVHYYPKYWAAKDHVQEAKYALPPNWADKVEPKEKKYPALTMEGTSYREKTCPNDWCNTLKTIKWSGPGEEGVWIDPAFEKHPLDIHSRTRTVSVQ